MKPDTPLEAKKRAQRDLDQTNRLWAKIRATTRHARRVAELSDAQVRQNHLSEVVTEAMHGRGIR